MQWGNGKGLLIGGGGHSEPKKKGGSEWELIKRGGWGLIVFLFCFFFRWDNLFIYLYEILFTDKVCKGREARSEKGMLVDFWERYII